MTTPTNIASVNVGLKAEWSADRKTIFNALVVNGVSYDIQVDASRMGEQAAKDVLPSIQAIFQKVAEQGLTKEQKNSVMNCFYDGASKCAVLTVDNKSDVAHRISVDSEKLRAELGEDNSFVDRMGPKAGAARVMEYVSERLLCPAYVANKFSVTPSKPVTPPHSTPDASRYDRLTKAEETLRKCDAEVKKRGQEYNQLKPSKWAKRSQKGKPHKALSNARERLAAAEIARQVAKKEHQAVFREVYDNFCAQNPGKHSREETMARFAEHRKSMVNNNP